jgi:hypothetical protein
VFVLPVVLLKKLAEEQDEVCKFKVCSSAVSAWGQQQICVVLGLLLRHCF